MADDIDYHFGRNPRFNCVEIWAQRKTFILLLGGSGMPAFFAYRCRLVAIEFVVGTLAHGA